MVLLRIVLMIWSGAHERCIVLVRIPAVLSSVVVRHCQPDPCLSKKANDVPAAAAIRLPNSLSTWLFRVGVLRPRVEKRREEEERERKRANKGR